MTINYKLKTNLLDEESDPSEYIYVIEGNILAYDYELEKEVLAAKIRLMYFNLDAALNNGMPIFEVFDSDSESCGYFENLYDIETEELSEETTRTLGYDEPDEIYFSNLLVVDKIEVLPKYRGQGLAKKIISHSIKLYQNETFATALHAFPLQFSGKKENPPKPFSKWNLEVGLDKLETNEEKAKESLMSFYESMGFKRVGQTEFMIYNNEKYGELD